MKLAIRLGRSTAQVKESPKWREKLHYVNEMKAYIIPFLHTNPVITRSLFRSYTLLAISKLCFFGGPLFLKQGINGLSLATAASYDPLLMFLGFGICYSGSVLFESLRNLESLKIINIALVETASNSYKHMLSLGPEFYFSGSQRTILFNLFKSQTAFEHNLRSFTQYFFPVLLDVCLSVALLLYYSNSLFALSFVTCYGAYSFFTIKYSDWRRQGIKRFRESEKNLDFITSETFTNYYNVKYFQKQGAELAKYKQALEDYYVRNYEVQKSLGFLNTVQRGIFGCGLTFNMILAAYYTQLGLLSTGDIIMIQTLMMQFLSPLFFLGSMYRSFEDNLMDIRQITKILQTPANVQEGTKSLPQLRGDVAFEQVSFKYLHDAENILDKLSFTVKENAFIAIVGRSGIGKTTILNLLFRLYDPLEGKVTIDGYDLRQLKFDFRNSISFVSQTPTLFNGTVMENLKFGNEASTDEEVMALTKQLNLHNIIIQLPDQYNQNVGEKGNIFSGGEKQRISLIRALLKKGKVMLLDEPTSSVDLETEKIVGRLLKQYSSCTRIMITHREGILAFCDHVIHL